MCTIYRVTCSGIGRAGKSGESGKLQPRKFEHLEGNYDFSPKEIHTTKWEIFVGNVNFFPGNLHFFQPWPHRYLKFVPQPQQTVNNCVKSKGSKFCNYKEVKSCVKFMSENCAVLKLTNNYIVLKI